VIGDAFDGLFCGSALLGLKSLPHPLSWVWGRSVFGYLYTPDPSFSLLLKKVANFMLKFRFFCVSGDFFGTTLSRRSRL